jgi:TctA family transporter
MNATFSSAITVERTKRRRNAVGKKTKRDVFFVLFLFMFSFFYDSLSLSLGAFKIDLAVRRKRVYRRSARAFLLFFSSSVLSSVAFSRLHDALSIV